MTGYGDEIVGRNCRFLQGPDTDPVAVAQLREAMAAERTFRTELRNYRKDGTPFWNELTISPVHDAAGKLVNFVGVQNDVTERKRCADALQRSYDALRKLEGLRDNLTGMLIHGFRAPLTAVVGFLDLLSTFASKKLSAEEQNYIAGGPAGVGTLRVSGIGTPGVQLGTGWPGMSQGFEFKHVPVNPGGTTKIASAGAETLQEMITSLLDVNRLEAGEMPMNLEKADLREVVASALDPFRALLEDRVLARDFPAIPVEVQCDVELVRRVITNLVSNAVKFTPRGGDIRVTIACENGRAKISVADTGPGIPEEYHVRIFEKFGQVDGRKHRHSTGLGLTFCKLAIEAQGGTIGIESVEAKGTTFSFVI